MIYLKHKVELTRINIFCLLQNLQLEESDHAEYIEVVNVAIRIHTEDGNKTMVDSWENQFNRAERSMASRRGLAWVQKKRERGYLNYYLEKVEILKTQEEGFAKNRSIS